MANKRKDGLREEVRKLKRENPKLTYKEIADKVGLPDRQWVYYFLTYD